MADYKDSTSMTARDRLDKIAFDKDPETWSPFGAKAAYDRAKNLGKFLHPKGAIGGLQKAVDDLQEERTRPVPPVLRDKKEQQGGLEPDLITPRSK